jgi:hypothetical protein
MAIVSLALSKFVVGIAVPFDHQAGWAESEIYSAGDEWVPSYRIVRCLGPNGGRNRYIGSKVGSDLKFCQSRRTKEKLYAPILGVTQHEQLSNG